MHGLTQAAARSLLGAALAILLLLLAPPAAEAQQRRVALVIGNGAYEHTPRLVNPANDARRMAELLRASGMEVIEGIDLDRQRMNETLREFGNRLEGGAVGLFFYAGHGLQVAGENYLLPVDARLQRERDLEFEAIPLGRVLRVMEDSVPTRLVFLDACRDNPLAQSLARGMGTRSAAIGRGLGAVTAGRGTMVSYATQPGNVALDGEGENSPFTAALLRHLAEPGLDVSLAMRRVREAVLEQTGQRQVPWEHSSLVGEVVLVPALAVVPPPPPPPPAAEPAPVPPIAIPGMPQMDRDALFWASVAGSQRIADFEEYLRAFPDGIFAGLARNRIAGLRAPPPAVAALPPAALPPAVAPAVVPPAAPQQTPPVVAALPAPATRVVPTPPAAPTRPVLFVSLNDQDSLRIRRGLAALGFDPENRLFEAHHVAAALLSIRAFQDSRREPATGDLTPAQYQALVARGAEPVPIEREPAFLHQLYGSALPEQQRSAGRDWVDRWARGQLMQRALIGALGRDPTAAERAALTGLDEAALRTRLRAAQREAGLPPTGTLTRETLATLLRRASNTPAALRLDRLRNRPAELWQVARVHTDGQWCSLMLDAIQIEGIYASDFWPILFFEAFRTWNRGDLGLNFLYSGYFEPGSPVHVVVDGRRIAADRSGANGNISFRAGDRAIPAAIAGGRRVSVEGTGLLGGPLRITFSAQGFTAAWRELDRCRGGGMMTWISG
jgi:hypothetical protein